MIVRDAMHTFQVTIDPHRSLREALVAMETLKVNRLLVLLGARLVGVLTDGDVIRHLSRPYKGLTSEQSALRAEQVKVSEAMSPTVLTTTPGALLEDAIHVMLDRQVGGLPVLDEEGLLIGMLTLTDVLRAASTAPRNIWGAVRDHMTHGAISVDVATPVSEATARLKGANLKVLPVTENGRLVGVIHRLNAENAASWLAVTHGDPFSLPGMTARDLMHPPGGVSLSSVPLRDAVMQMLGAEVHGLPVVDDSGHLLGVLTITDVLKTLLGAPTTGHGPPSPVT